MKNKSIGIGIMSGTSLDGVDIALCEFENINLAWKYNIIHASTVKYDDKWKSKLTNCHELQNIDLLKLHKTYGFYLGELIREFILQSKIKPDFIASHGHTIFHQPQHGLTFQLGDGACIAEKTGILTVSDFRNQDVILGGQGAPLVPFGDELLFPDFDYCLNLGGFSNISFKKDNQRIAFDIGPVNIVLNHLSNKLGFEYDNKGELAKQGSIDPELFTTLNSIEYYQKTYPKSLGREWVTGTFFPILNASKSNLKNKLRTTNEHIAIQISMILNAYRKAKVIITGGGVYNDFLIELIKQKTNQKIIIPDDNIIDFKEALIFAFLGLMKINDKINCLSSVTGARKDHSSGVIHKI